MSNNFIKVFSPCSVANVGCGFDTFGFAIEEWGDIVSLKKRSDNSLVIQEVKGASLPLEPKENIVTVAIQSLLDELKIKVGLDIFIEKLVSPGSGLGSSACSANAAVFALNKLLNLGKTKNELIPYAMKGEFVASKSIHADNIAPSMLGGFQIVRSYEPTLDIFNIKCPENLFILIIFPQVVIKTSESRKLLSNNLSLKQARNQFGNVAGLTAGLITENWDLIQKSTVDFIAEPLRKSLIPNYDEVKNICFENGSVGFNISGSGPTMFAFYPSKEKAEKTIPFIKKIYLDEQIDCLFHVSKINLEGTIILKS